MVLHVQKVSLVYNTEVRILLKFSSYFFVFHQCTINESARAYFLDYWLNIFHQMYQKIFVVQSKRVLKVNENSFNNMLHKNSYFYP